MSLVHCWCCGGIVELDIAMAEGYTLLTHSFPFCYVFDQIESTEAASEYYDRCLKKRDHESS